MKKLLFLLVSSLATVSFAAVIGPPGGGGLSPSVITNLINALAFTNSHTLFVDTNGNDATAVRGVQSLPYKTLTAAKTAAGAGDTVLVMPGKYVENDLLKNKVNWFFMTGAEVFWTNIASAGLNKGLFDDRAVGAVRCAIAGNGTFWYNGMHYSNATDVGSIVITQENTEISFEADALYCSTADLTSTAAAVWIRRCSNAFFNVKKVRDPLNGSTVYHVWDEGDEEFRDIGSQIFGLFVDSGYVTWRSQDLHIGKDRVLAAGGGTDTQVSVTNVTSRLFLSFESQLCGYGPWPDSFCQGASGQGLVVDALMTNSAVQFKAGLTDRIYVTGDGNGLVNLDLETSGNVWVMGGQHVTIKAGEIQGRCGFGLFVNDHAARVFAIVDRLRDTGDGDPVIEADAGMLTLRVGEAAASQIPHGTPGATPVVSVSGGIARLTGRFVGSATNDVIAYASGTLILENATLVSQGSNLGISGTGTVGIYGHVISRTDKAGTITLSPLGAFTVDSNVQ